MEESAAQNSKLQKHLAELVDRLTDPVHKRLIQAYEETNPRESMEEELGVILIEVLHRED